MALAAVPELWFLPFAIVIGLWVTWSDLARMTIPNRAVLATLAVFFFVGLLALPLETWAWRWLHFGVAIVAGFLLSAGGAMGAGDAKFLAATAPFIAVSGLALYATILFLVIIVTFAGHRLFRRTAFARARFAHWDSLERREFPMGIALAPTWVIYLAMTASGA